MKRWVSGLMVVAAMAAGGGADASEAAYRELLRSYDRVHVDAIVWGNEAGTERHVGLLDPPYFTRHPARVEVIELVSHRSGTWQGSRRLTVAWAASLPPEVMVRTVAEGVGSRKKPRTPEWRMEQELYCAAKHLGLEREGHGALARFPLMEKIARRKGVRKFALMIGVEHDRLAEARKAPEVAECIATSLDLGWQLGRAGSRAGGARGRLMRFPRFIINGKYAVDSSVVQNTVNVYRMANRLIRLELERGRAHDGPTNDEEFAHWLEPRAGEVFSRVTFGKRLQFKGVYSAARKEIWGLNEDGSFKDASPLVGEGDDAYWRWMSPQGEVRDLHLWMRGAQYVSYETPAGRPQRYGAFVLTDYLSAPDTLWVGLPWQGTDTAFAFSADGSVEARSGDQSVFGSWWLEAGNLNVSMGEFGHESWPWQEAAAHVGFEVPRESVVPWEVERERERAARAEERKKVPAAVGERGK